MSYVLNVIYIPLACNEDVWFIKLTWRNAGSELYECDKEVWDYAVGLKIKERALKALALYNSHNHDLLFVSFYIPMIYLYSEIVFFICYWLIFSPLYIRCLFNTSNKKTHTLLITQMKLSFRLGDLYHFVPTIVGTINWTN